MFAVPSFAATMTISFYDSDLLASKAESILGRDDVSGIEAFTFWFSVDSDFSFDNVLLGDAVPTNGMLGWDIDSNKVANEPGYGLVYKLGAFDQDGLLLDDPNYLRDGIVVTFDFGGGLGDLVVVQFDPGDGSNLFGDVIKSRDVDASGPNFQAVVPIPGAVWLLGSGLVGLVGLKRRKKA